MSRLLAIQYGSMILFMKDVSDDMVNVFAGTDVIVPCFPTGGIHLLASDTDDVKYKWTHQHDKPISGSLTTIQHFNTTSRLSTLV